MTTNDHTESDSATPGDGSGAPSAPDGLEFPLRRSVQLLAEDPVTAKKAFKAAAEANAPCPSCGKPVRHREGVEWCRDQQMSEAVLQRRVVARAKKRGWDVKHVGKGLTSTDEGVWVSTAKSFPDLFMLHEAERRPLAIELKRERGDFEPGQLAYLQLLNLCGIPAVVIRPHHLRDGTVNAILGPQ